VTRRHLGLLAGTWLATSLLAGCYTYPYPYGYPAPAPGPSRYDQAWDAAMGAASDCGIQVTSGDRASGRITGDKAGAAVTITVQGMADGRVQVGFDAPTSKETNPTLSDRWLAAYNRRMGR
jgi:hypothetical protein